MDKDVIAALEAEMARAVADEDFEIAAILRDRLEAMREGRRTGSMLRRPGLDELGASDHQTAARPRTGSGRSVPTP